MLRYISCQKTLKDALVNTTVLSLLSFMLTIVLTIAWVSATSAQKPPTLEPTTSPQFERGEVEHLGNIEVAPISRNINQL